MAKLPHHAVKHNLVARIPSLHHGHDSYKWWVLVNIMIGTFIAVLDSTIVNVGLPDIMASFGTSIDKIEWVITAYMLAFGIVLPACGWVADHIGYKRTYFIALGIFTLGSFLCGLAWNETSLITFRVIQGIGAGFIMPVGMAIVMREFPARQRGMALGFWGIAAAASVSFGPLIGGYLIDNVSWQAIFDVNVPIGIFGMLATWVIQREYRSESVRDFDFWGFFSMAVFLTSLLLALSEGNASWNTGGWSSNFILSCFAISLIGFVVFIFVEMNAKHPFVDLKLFKNFNFGVTNIILFIFGLSMFGSTFLLPLYLQNALGYTAYQSGLVFLPVGILQGMISPISGIMSDKLDARIPAITGIILLTLSFFLNNSLSLFSEHTQIMIPLYLRGLAMGLLFTPLSSLALSGISKHQMAQASGLFNVIRQIGGSFGIAIFGTILTQRNIYHMALYGQAVDVNSAVFKAVSSNLARLVQWTGGNTINWSSMQANAIIGTHVAQQAFVQAVDDAFFVAAVISVLAVFPVIFLSKSRNNSNSKNNIVE
ncbi:MAG: DHA2 family efflux MFS transporter permease subunit [Endomicrobiales bacterium]|nr:DHA2 family efflux MFS transporter permease subunit [Endomicrobiales bacterium]